MSAALVSVASKLAKLIPRLASNHPGEVVATVSAIGRTLKAVKLDFHDLAAAVSTTRPMPVENVPLYWRDIPASERASWLVAAMGSDRCSAWEKNFADSILAQLRYRPWSDLSPKQVAVLDRIVSKLAGGEP